MSPIPAQTTKGSVPPTSLAAIQARFEAIERDLLNIHQTIRQPTAPGIAGLADTQALSQPADGALVSWSKVNGAWIPTVSPPGGELSNLEYNPVGSGSYSLTSTSLVQVDGAHLAMPAFVVPANGKVRWWFQAIGNGPAIGSGNLFLQPYDTTLGLLSRVWIFIQTISTGTVHAVRTTGAWDITGLTPGATVAALQPAYEVSGGTANLYYGGGNGSILQVVTAIK